MSKESTEVLAELPPRRRGRPDKYPWSDWFDGRVHKLIRDKHFPDVKDAHVMRMMAYSAGKRHEVAVHAYTDGYDVLIVQADVE